MCHAILYIERNCVLRIVFFEFIIVMQKNGNLKNNEMLKRC